MRISGVGADHKNDVRLLHRHEGLCSCRSSICLPQAVARGRVADTCACIYIVVAKCSAHHLLHEVSFLVGTTGRGDSTHRADTIFLLDAANLRCSIFNGFFPADLLPGVVDGLAYHGGGDAVLVSGIAKRETPLDTGMTFVGLTVLPRNHAHDLVTLHFSLETAANSAIGASGDHCVFGLPQLNDRFFLQRRRRASLDTGPAGNAVTLQK